MCFLFLFCPVFVLRSRLRVGLMWLAPRLVPRPCLGQRFVPRPVPRLASACLGLPCPASGCLGLASHSIERSLRNVLQKSSEFGLVLPCHHVMPSHQVKTCHHVRYMSNGPGTTLKYTFELHLKQTKLHMPPRAGICNYISPPVPKYFISNKVCWPSKIKSRLYFLRSKVKYSFKSWLYF